MPTPSYILELIKKLNDKTIERKISWTTTSRAAEFKYYFQGGAVTVDSWHNEHSVNYADIMIYNADGGLVERVVLNETEENYENLRDLYINVTKSINKSDETFSSLFKELDNL